MSDFTPSEIPGFLGPAPSIRERFDALGDDDMGIPTSWTPEHVQARMVEAFRIVGRDPRVGPRSHANGWPEYLKEFGDMTDLIEDEALAERRRKITAVEASRMNETLAWPMAYLSGRALAADALMTWAFAVANNRDMAAMLNRRKKRAMALAIEMAARANAPPHRHPETGDIMDTRSPEALARVAHRGIIAREVAADTNARLAKAPRTSHAEIRTQAQATFRAKCRDAVCLPVVVKPIEAMPGRVMARTTLDRHRKIAASVIAEALRKAGVAVR